MQGARLTDPNYPELVRTFYATDSTVRHRHYQRWNMMVNRCHNPESQGYPQYGARGIAVCDRWRASFFAFLSDMGWPPFPKATIERKDNDLGYSPENCVWATHRDNANNCRSKFETVHEGRKISLPKLCAIKGISYDTIYNRITRKGMTVEEALAAG